MIRSNVSQLTTSIRRSSTRNSIARKDAAIIVIVMRIDPCGFLLIALSWIVTRRHRVRTDILRFASGRGRRDMYRWMTMTNVFLNIHCSRRCTARHIGLSWYHCLHHLYLSCSLSSDLREGNIMIRYKYVCTHSREMVCSLFFKSKSQTAMQPLFFPQL